MLKSPTLSISWRMLKLLMYASPAEGEKRPVSMDIVVVLPGNRLVLLYSKSDLVVLFS